MPFHVLAYDCFALPYPGMDAAWPADGARRARAPQALLNAFEPGAVVTGTVSEHLLGHGILVDVGGMYDGCAENPTPPFALARRRAAASARTWCWTGRQSTSLMLGSGVTDGDCCSRVLGMRARARGGEESAVHASKLCSARCPSLVCQVKQICAIYKRKAGMTRRRARARLLPTKLRGFDIARNPYNDATATTESLVALVEPDDAQLREYAAQVRAASAADLFAGAVPWTVTAEELGIRSKSVLQHVASVAHGRCMHVVVKLNSSGLDQTVYAARDLTGRNTGCVGWVDMSACVRRRTTGRKPGTTRGRCLARGCTRARRSQCAWRRRARPHAGRHDGLPLCARPGGALCPTRPGCCAVHCRHCHGRQRERSCIAAR